MVLIGRKPKNKNMVLMHLYLTMKDTNRLKLKGWILYCAFRALECIIHADVLATSKRLSEFGFLLFKNQQIA